MTTGNLARYPFSKQNVCALSLRKLRWRLWHSYCSPMIVILSKKQSFLLQL